MEESRGFAPNPAKGGLFKKSPHWISSKALFERFGAKSCESVAKKHLKESSGEDPKGTQMSRNGNFSLKSFHATMLLPI